MRILFALLVLLLLSIPAAALEVPKAREYVTDLADLISADAESKLNSHLRAFEQSDSTQIVVLTISTLEGESLEEYALQVLTTWGVGQRAKDNGALLLVAKQERKIRIEVGYGLEGRLTDLLAGRIIDNEISPSFKRGDFDGGILRGVVAITKAVRGEYTGNGKTTGQGKSEGSPIGLLFLFFFILPLFFRMLGGRSGRRGKNSGLFLGGPFTGGGGGFSSGGGFSGGGGFGGGGGASGGW